MVAVKGNIEYTINEAEKAEYIKNGFDIYENGKKIADGVSKKVSYTEYKKVKDELEKLKATQFNKEEVDELIEASALKDKELAEVGAQKAELETSLKAKDNEIAELKATIKAKNEEIKKLKG